MADVLKPNSELDLAENRSIPTIREIPGGLKPAEPFNPLNAPTNNTGVAPGQVETMLGDAMTAKPVIPAGTTEQQLKGAESLATQLLKTGIQPKPEEPLPPSVLPALVQFPVEDVDPNNAWNMRTTYSPPEPPQPGIKSPDYRGGAEQHPVEDLDVNNAWNIRPTYSPPEQWQPSKVYKPAKAGACGICGSTSHSTEEHTASVYDSPLDELRWGTQTWTGDWNLNDAERIRPDPAIPAPSPKDVLKDWAVPTGSFAQYQQREVERLKQQNEQSIYLPPARLDITAPLHVEFTPSPVNPVDIQQFIQNTRQDLAGRDEVAFNQIERVLDFADIGQRWQAAALADTSPSVSDLQTSLDYQRAQAIQNVQTPRDNGLSAVANGAATNGLISNLGNLIGWKEGGQGSVGGNILQAGWSGIKNIVKTAAGLGQGIGAALLNAPIGVIADIGKRISNGEDWRTLDVTPSLAKGYDEALYISKPSVNPNYQTFGNVLRDWGKDVAVTPAGQKAPTNFLQGKFGDYGSGTLGATFYAVDTFQRLATSGLYTVTDALDLDKKITGSDYTGNRFVDAFQGRDTSFMQGRTNSNYLSTVDPNAKGWVAARQYGTGFIADLVTGGVADAFFGSALKRTTNLARAAVGLPPKALGSAAEASAERFALRRPAALSGADFPLSNTDLNIKSNVPRLLSGEDAALNRKILAEDLTNSRARMAANIAEGDKRQLAEQMEALRVAQNAPRKPGVNYSPEPSKPLQIMGENGTTYIKPVPKAPVGVAKTPIAAVPTGIFSGRVEYLVREVNAEVNPKLVKPSRASGGGDWLTTIPNPAQPKAPLALIPTANYNTSLVESVVRPKSEMVVATPLPRTSVGGSLVKGELNLGEIPEPTKLYIGQEIENISKKAAALEQPAGTNIYLQQTKIPKVADTIVPPITRLEELIPSTILEPGKNLPDFRAGYIKQVMGNDSNIALSAVDAYINSGILRTLPENTSIVKVVDQNAANSVQATRQLYVLKALSAANEVPQQNQLINYIVQRLQPIATKEADTFVELPPTPAQVAKANEMYKELPRYASEVRKVVEATLKYPVDIDKTVNAVLTQDVPTLVDIASKTGMDLKLLQDTVALIPNYRSKDLIKRVTKEAHYNMVDALPEVLPIIPKEMVTAPTAPAEVIKARARLTAKGNVAAPIDAPELGKVKRTNKELSALARTTLDPASNFPIWDKKRNMTSKEILQFQETHGAMFDRYGKPIDASKLNHEGRLIEVAKPRVAAATPQETVKVKPLETNKIKSAPLGDHITKPEIIDDIAPRMRDIDEEMMFLSMKENPTQEDLARIEQLIKQSDDLAQVAEVKQATVDLVEKSPADVAPIERGGQAEKIVETELVPAHIDLVDAGMTAQKLEQELLDTKSAIQPTNDLAFELNPYGRQHIKDELMTQENFGALAPEDNPLRIHPERTDIATPPANSPKIPTLEDLFADVDAVDAGKAPVAKSSEVINSVAKVTPTSNIGAITEDALIKSDNITDVPSPVVKPTPTILDEAKAVTTQADFDNWYSKVTSSKAKNAADIVDEADILIGNLEDLKGMRGIYISDMVTSNLNKSVKHPQFTEYLRSKLPEFVGAISKDKEQLQRLRAELIGKKPSSYQGLVGDTLNLVNKALMTPEEKAVVTQLNSTPFFHGTKARTNNLEVLNPKGKASFGEFGDAIYFTSDPDIAEQYAKASVPINKKPVGDVRIDEVGRVFEAMPAVTRPLNADLKMDSYIKSNMMDVLREEIPDVVASMNSLSNIKHKDFMLRVRDEMVNVTGSANETKLTRIQGKYTAELKAAGYDSMYREGKDGVITLGVFNGENFKQHRMVTVGDGSITEAIAARNFVDEKFASEFKDSQYALANSVRSRTDLAKDMMAKTQEAFLKEQDLAEEAVIRLVHAEEKLDEVVKTEKKARIADIKRNTANPKEQDAIAQFMKDSDDLCL